MNRIKPAEVMLHRPDDGLVNQSTGLLAEVVNWLFVAVVLVFIVAQQWALNLAHRNERTADNRITQLTLENLALKNRLEAR